MHLPTKTAQSDSQEDPEELARFREQWKEEVRRKKEAVLAQTPQSPNLDNGSTSQPDRKLSEAKLPSNEPHPPPTTSRVILGPNIANDISPVPKPLSTEAKNIELTPKLRVAVDVYRDAVTHEQRSDLDQALVLYRKAFRMEPNVDKIFHMLEAQQLASRPHHHGRRGSIGKQGDGSTIPLDLGSLEISPSIPPVVVKLPANHGIVTGSLASLISSWPSTLVFEREEEKDPIPISFIPDEILVYVLSCLDVTSLERFALVNRKARIVSLDSSLWRAHVQAIYKPPQIPEDEDELEMLIGDYLKDHRRLYIEHPRIRLDGVYIAMCHYIRKGLSENAWVQINHLITYHRYLRFLPTGEVLSLLANEGLEPQQVIQMLKPTLRMKGFLIGHWKLIGTTILITNLQDPSLVAPFPIPNNAHPHNHPNHPLNNPNPTTKYTFQMTLELRSKPTPGRWNRLDFKAYDSVQVGSGELVPVALKHDRPFWFSKVRSYVP